MGRSLVRAAVPRVITLDPTKRGVAFAVFEGPRRLVDWGTRNIPAKGGKTYSGLVKKLFVDFSPDYCVLENPKETQRKQRAKLLIHRTVRLSLASDIPIEVASRAQVRAWSGLAKPTKDRIGRHLASIHPELLLRLPRERKVWMGEDDRMNIFDAISFALTFLDLLERRETD